MPNTQGQQPNYGKMKKAELVEALMARDRRIAELQAGGGPDLAGALEHIADAFILYDADERLLHYNRNMLDFYGFTDSDVAGEVHAVDLARLDVERDNIIHDLENPQAYVDERLENTRAGDRTMLIQLKNGHWLEARDRRTPDGGIVSIHRDVSDHVAAEHELARAEARLTDAIENISEGFTLFDSENRVVLCNTAFRDMYGYSAADAAPGTPVEKLIALDDERATIEDDETVRTLKRRADDFGTSQETFNVPLTNGRWVQIRDRRTAEGGTVSIHTDISERMAAEGARRTLLETIPVPISVISRTDGRYLYGNAATAELLGCTPEELVGFSAQDLYVNTGERGDFLDELERRGQVDDFEVEYQSRTGERFWALVASRLIDFQGEPAILSVWTVITRRKQAEAALRRSEALMADAIETIPDGFALYDADDVLVAHNRTFMEIFQLREEELTPETTWHDLIKRNQEKGICKGMTDKDFAISPKEHPSHDFLRHFADGRVMELRRRPASGGGILSIFTDVTERYKAEEEILAAKDAAAAAEALMMDAIEHVSEGFALFDSDDHMVLNNSKYREIYGYGDDDVPPGTPLAELIARDAERGAFADNQDTLAAMNRRTATYGETGETFDIPMADGRWIQIRDRRTSDGGTVSIHADVTQHKRAEEAVAEQTRLLNVTMENMGQGITMYDEDWKLVTYNDRYREQFDLPEDLFHEGQSFDNIVGATMQKDEGEGWREVMKKVKDPRRMTEIWERDMVRTNGRSINILSVPVPTGGFVVTTTDITERKRAEALLKAFLDNAGSPMFVK